MSGCRVRLSFAAAAALLSSACATSPGAGVDPRPEPADESSAAGLRALIKLDVAGDAPVLRRQEEALEALFESNLDLGFNNELLRYEATYELEPGEVLTLLSPDSRPTSAPTRIGGQRLGQNVRLTLPELAGAPVALGVATETRNNWLLSGGTETQRERASLDWSPGSATVSMQWSGAATTFDAAVALSCDFESTFRLPTREGKHRSQSLHVAGRDCVVSAQDTAYAGLEAQAWALGYVWSRAQQQSEAVLSVIDPAWTSDIVSPRLDPSYELDLSHRRDVGALSAKALVSLRQAPVRYVPGSFEQPGGAREIAYPEWAANASVTWQLADASVSANWAQGVDPLWFTPESGGENERVGLALNLSQWIESLVPGSSPEFAMRWNWSRLRLPGEEAVDDNSLSVDVALLF